MSTRRSCLYGVLVTVSCLSLSAQISCPTVPIDDMFSSGAPCTPVNGVFPVPGDFVIAGKTGQIVSCYPLSEAPIVVSFQFGVAIGDMISLTVNVAGAQLFASTSQAWARYARTFVVTAPDGLGDFQVWRYLVSAPLTYQTGSQPFPRPPCSNGVGLPPFNDGVAGFKGFLDVACRSVYPDQEEPTPGSQHTQTYHALLLSHHEGCFEHANLGMNANNPNLGSYVYPRALAGGSAFAHDDVSYHIVAPTSFQFAPVSLPSDFYDLPPGNSLESVRSNGSAQAPLLLAETPLTSFITSTATETVCLCPVWAPPFASWFLQTLSGMGTFGAPFWSMSPLFLVGTVPTAIAPTFAQHHIGRWQGASNSPPFPYGVSVASALGVLVGNLSCGYWTMTQVPISIVNGVTTVQETMTASLINQNVSGLRTFTDLQDTWVFPSQLFSGPMTRGLGAHARSMLLFMGCSQ